MHPLLCLLILHLPAFNSNVCWVCTCFQKLFALWASSRANSGMDWFWHGEQRLGACKICRAQLLNLVSTTSSHSRLDGLKFLHYLWLMFFYHISNLLYLLYINPLTLDVRSKSLLIACRVTNFINSCFTKYAISVHTIEVRISADWLAHFHLFCHDHVNWLPISPLDFGTSCSHIVVHSPWNHGFIS